MNDNHSKYLTSLFFDCLTTYQNGELGRTASILSCQQEQVVAKAVYISQQFLRQCHVGIHLPQSPLASTGVRACHVEPCRDEAITRNYKAERRLRFRHNPFETFSMLPQRADVSMTTSHYCHYTHQVQLYHSHFLCHLLPSHCTHNAEDAVQLIQASVSLYPGIVLVDPCTISKTCLPTVSFLSEYPWHKKSFVFINVFLISHTISQAHR